MKRKCCRMVCLVLEKKEFTATRWTLWSLLHSGSDGRVAKNPLFPFLILYVVSGKFYLTGN